MWLLDNSICMTYTSSSPLYLLGHTFQTLNCSFCLPFRREESIQLVFMRKCCLFSSPSHVRKLRPKAVKSRSQTLTLKPSLDMLRTTERTLLPAWRVGPAFQLTLKPESSRSLAAACGPTSNQKLHVAIPAWAFVFSILDGTHQLEGTSL